MLTRGVDQIQSLIRDLGLTETLRSVGACIAIQVREGEIHPGHDLIIPRDCTFDIQSGYDYAMTKESK